MTERNCDLCVHHTACECDVWKCEYIPKDEAIQAFKAAKKGEWIIVGGLGGQWCECSECGYTPQWHTKLIMPWEMDMKYCPACGARLERSKQ